MDARNIYELISYLKSIRCNTNDRSSTITRLRDTLFVSLYQRLTYSFDDENCLNLDS